MQDPIDPKVDATPAEPTFWDKVTVQPDDTRAQATVKILTGIGLAILLLVISPLIIFGLIVGLMTVA